MNTNTFTAERKAMLTEDLRFEALEMVELLGVLEVINAGNEDFFNSINYAFEHLIETKPHYAAKAFTAYSRLTALFRIAASRQPTLDLKLNEYREIINEINTIEEAGGSLADVKFKATV